MRKKKENLKRSVRCQWLFAPLSLSRWDEKPQPDNRNQLRDRCEPELCIGVLNNFYADGIVWHDVACHHKKPTICEWTN